MTTANTNERAWICSFHITWIAFWFCFFVWFSTSNIYSILSSDDNLKSLTIVDHQIAGGLSITSTILFRIIIAYFLPKYGSRICYVTVLSLTSITLIFLTISNSKLGYFICHCCLGITGASFVITQYHTTQMVSNRVVGFAQAITAGFGNFGGGCANSVMPLLLYHFGLSWRIYMILLSGFLLILASVYWFHTEDVFQSRTNMNMNMNTNKNIKVNPKPQLNKHGQNSTLNCRMLCDDVEHDQNCDHIDIKTQLQITSRSSIDEHEHRILFQETMDSPLENNNDRSARKLQRSGCLKGIYNYNFCISYIYIYIPVHI